MSEKTIFFAYKGKNDETHDDNVDSIRHAAREFNLYQKTYKAQLWEDFKTTTHISSEVLKAISTCEVFVCDLTYFNHNVLFELGYAIAQKKNVLILLNPDIDGAGDKYKDFFLKEARYTSFKNSNDIKAALQQKNYRSDLLDAYVNLGNLEKDSLDLLYIKSKLKNQPALDLSDKIQFLKDSHDFSLLVDDPQEVAYRSEAWYFQNIYKAKCVIIHFWGESVRNALIENAQNSFLAGLAYGLGGKVLLVAPAKFRAPLDYYEILSTYSSSEDLVDNVDGWLTKELLTKQIEENIEKIKEHQSSLIRLGIGCEVAEYEKEDLLKYFVDTSPYRSALAKERVVIVGRKGSGKTAIYIKLLDELSKSNLNYIINIKPESDELLEDAQLSGVFTNKSTKKSFFISAWRLTIFSKLAYSVYEKITNYPSHTERTQEEDKLVEFVSRHEVFMRMNIFGVVVEIHNKVKARAVDINSPKILEELYREYLTELIHVLKTYFGSVKSKYSKIIIIADNLDRAWNAQENLDIQSEMIVSLLEVENKIKNELLNKDNSQINFKTIIFLRKDIFEYILRMVNEPDKLTLLQNEIKWEEYPELLQKVIENRFRYGLGLGADENIDKIWAEYFKIKRGKKPFDAIRSIVTLRPRDVIYFVSQLFDSAINRGGDSVINSDFEKAIVNYTNFLNENLIAETKAEYPEVSEILAKLQEHHGKKLEYKVFLKILDTFGYNPKRKKEFTKTLFDKGYMLGFDTVTDRPFDDPELLEEKLKEKKMFFFPNEVYIIAHAKYYTIKNIADKPF